MILSIARIIDVLVNLISLLVIAHVFLSYIFPPYHPSRMFIDRMVNPLLLPIRRAVPTVGMFDFSPMILLVGVQLAGWLVKSILFALL